VSIVNEAEKLRETEIAAKAMRPKRRPRRNKPGRNHKKTAMGRQRVLEGAN